MRILYIDIDTLRPDHLGCYGYHRNTSPNIDRIAAEGVRFEQYYCSDAPCLPSRAALMTGRFGIHNGIVNHGGTGADLRLEGENRGFISRVQQECLTALFRNAGLHTASISPFAERHGAWWFNAGFDETHNTGKRGLESAEEVTPIALDWIERKGKEDNWFLHINYWDPHTPYRAPDSFGNPFENEPIPDWLTPELLAHHRTLAGPHGPWEINMYDDKVPPIGIRHLGQITDMEDYRRFIDGYDCGIAYADHHVGMLLDALEKQGVLDDLIIIVSSDHGENMGELGIYGEHATADAITPRIPMIIRWPGMTAPGQVAEGFHYNLDLVPTIAELLEMPQKKGWDGTSYAATLRDGTNCGHPELILSQCAHVCQRSVRFDDWMYIRTYHDGYHLFPDEMLFNVTEDPHEVNNIAAEYPDIVNDAARRLLTWHDRMMATMDPPTDADPLWRVMMEGGPLHARGHLDSYCARLEATGRGDKVAELRARHPGK